MGLKQQHMSGWCLLTQIASLLQKTGCLDAAAGS